MYPEHLKEYLPPDFDLANYQETANMDLTHWLDNLLSRRTSYRCVLMKDYEFNLYKCNSDDEYVQQLHELSRNGLSGADSFKLKVLDNLIDGAAVTDNVESIVNIYIEEDSKLENILSEVNYVDLLSLEKTYLTDEVRDKYSKIERSMLPIVTEMNYGELKEPIYSRDVNDEIEFSWLKIAMVNSDSEIKEAFNDWLKQYREKHKPTIKEKRRVHKLKTINKTTLRKWHEARVLAYIDIVSWNFLWGKKITSSILGEIIFPEPKIISDRAKMIEDTTKPYADRLTSDNFIERLKRVVISQKRKEKL